MLVHVHNLSFHRHEKENKEIHEQYGPKDGHIKDGEKRHAKARQGTPCAGEPEFEFRQTARKGSEFLSFRRCRGKALSVRRVFEFEG